MLLTRQQLEQRENALLAPYAVKSSESRGRTYNEPPDPYRTCFQHDRDRVIHSKAFRRLKGKTQVFVAHYGDHYRSRLTHTMEVAQLSRDLARMLNLNEDLAETIALAHDLGHTPFGHTGQETMDEIMKKFGESFEHNEQSRRVVEYLEEKKSEFKGLNLSFEVRDGLIKHRTPYDNPKMVDTLMPSIEAQIVNMADEIAYMNHDIDDGLRAGIIKMHDLNKLPIWLMVLEKIDKNATLPFRISAMISGLIKIMIENLANNTNKLIEKTKIKNVEQVYKISSPLCMFTKDFYNECAKLKNFLYEKFYKSPGVSKYNIKGKKIISFLFKKLMNNPNLMPDIKRFKENGSKIHILVKDYIAGMTDQFALNLYNKLK